MSVDIPNSIQNTEEQHMIPVKLARILYQEKSQHVIFVLLDEQRQIALPLLFTNMLSDKSDIRTDTSPQRPPVSAEIVTGNFISRQLNALGGTLEEIGINLLQSGSLYAQVHFRTAKGSHMLKGHLDDALLLALRLKCSLTVAEEVFRTMGVPLTDENKTQKQQTDKIAAIMSWFPLRMTAQPSVGFNTLLTSRTPRNLDFAQALQGWMIFGYPVNPKSYKIHFDSNITYGKKSSLVISLPRAELSSKEAHVSLTHEGFLATNYRGQRLRMVAYAKAEDVKRADFHLAIVGPTIERNSVQTTQHITSTQQYPVEGTSDWTAYELVIDVPENANSIQISFRLENYGTIWLDSIGFEVVNRLTPLTGTRIVPPPHQPQNLDFAHDLEYWYLAGTFPQDYRYSINYPPFPNHKASLSIAAIQPEARGNTLFQQTLHSYEYRGKRVRFFADIKATNIEQQASIYINMGIETNAPQTQQLLQGTTNWTRYEVVLDIVNANTYINFGFDLHGQGQIYLTNIGFESIGPIR